MKKVLSQEWLKLIACVTMLLDHVGAVFFPQYHWLRVVGRIAFPIYCFLLAEGITHTGSPKKYGVRLLVGVVLSEFSFDYLFYGGITFAHQSVMITLLLGFLMAQWMRKVRKFGAVVPLAVCFLAAEWMKTDYGGWGVALIWLFLVARGQKFAWVAELLGMALICWLMESASIWIGPVRLPIQLFGLLGLVPILLYSGRKSTDSRWIQWGFYLFYPVHLTVLLAIVVITR